MISLKNKTILITGASSGIGRAVAVLFAELGAKIILSARSGENLAETSSLCKGGGSIVTADLTNEEGIKNLATSCPAIDGWVHCTGKVLPVPAKFIQEKHLEDILNVNFKSAVKLCSGLLTQKKLKEKSSIVFISSVSTLHSYFGGGPYIASKAALEGYAKTLALELAPKKIRVNVLQPALVKTHIYESTVAAAMSAEEMKNHEKRYPLGIGTPLDVAEACAYFVSDASKWITGSFLKMDGGLTLGIS
ncbi:MAG: SDR family oxidoreductase [Bacteroidia bacterium]|nr:SDR family oxidoreductase [Bacteroidia bacterium]